jgi:arginine decarboxylase
MRRERATTSPETAREEQAAPALAIEVVSGVGFGPTKLAAFDAALREAGVADFNLLRMSSIIPAGSAVTATSRSGAPPGEWGDRLYVVMADQRVDTRNEEAVAGIGWVQERETGRGLFVEHVGHTEREVRRDVLSTLESLTAGRPGLVFGTPDFVVRSTVCTDEPTCALVVAVYQSSGWRPQPVIDLR